MQASKVKFSQETKAALNARPLSKAAKAKLRRERVKDYIRSQPAGAIIKQTELAAAAGYDQSQGHGWAFVNRMIKNGHITKDTSEGAHRPSWTVKGDARVVRQKAEVKVPDQPMPTPEPTQHFRFEATSTSEFAEAANGWTKQLAKEFAWQYNSDSLREFIKWLGSK